MQGRTVHIYDFCIRGGKLSSGLIGFMAVNPLGRKARLAWHSVNSSSSRTVCGWRERELSKDGPINAYSNLR